MSETIQQEPRRLDLRGSMAALRRAAQRAREEAIRTQTDLIQMRDGKMQRVSPMEKQKQGTNVEEGITPVGTVTTRISMTR